MNPITRTEELLAAAAGEYDGTTPEPLTRVEQFMEKVIERMDNFPASPEQVQTAVNNYLTNSNLGELAAMQEFTDYLEG